MTETVAILGSTGSVGVSTLDVIRLHPDRFRISALSANTNVDAIFTQCQEFKPERVVMVDHASALRLRTLLAAKGIHIDVESGSENLAHLVSEGIDTVVCAIVGSVGLSSTLAAVKSGLRILVANKEPLVMLGPYIMNQARQHGAQILPLDSEHNAVFQCLPKDGQQLRGVGTKEELGIRRLILTGSGGPFRTLDPSAFPAITPDQACAHPNWQMGRKISVDSATMMNKGLELIEACALFTMDEKDIDIVVHPQSVVHSMVEYVDGSILAQMANPDMKVPIANALGWPDRIESGALALDLFASANFEFYPPDPIRFPTLTLARQAAQSGGNAPAILNAANEVAVSHFLQKKISFNRISELVAETMDKLPSSNTVDLDAILEVDRQARIVCDALVKAFNRQAVE